MRILHVSPMYPPILGGGELYSKEISEGLAARGHDVTVLTTNTSSAWDHWDAKPGNLPAAETVNGVKVVRLQPDGATLGKLIRLGLEMPGGYRGLNRLLSPPGYELFMQAPRTFGVIPYLLRSRADIVTSMSWYWPQAHYCHLARRVRRFRLVGIPWFHTAEGWCERGIYPRMLRNCDTVATMTEFEATFARDRGAQATDVVGVGIHPEAFEERNGPALREAHHIGQHPVVGFVGRPTANKGITVVLEAMRRVWETHPEVRLVIAGPNPPTRHDELRLDALSDFERSRIIRIADFSDQDKASIFDALDVFVLPSVAESFGIAYLEAWMCGKPVIGARIGPTSSVIEDGVDGLLARPNDGDDVAAKLLELLSDPAKRERMGRTGKAKTVKQHTWKRVVDRMEDVYRRVINQAPSRGTLAG